jgi:restriction endonuclease Mrr
MREIRRELCAIEDDPDLSAPAIYAAIRNENERMVALGQAAPFRTKREGEAYGWISTNLAGAQDGDPVQRIEAEIHRQNAAIDEKIREWLRKMDWRTFESKFLTQLLEKLGFQEVEVTQATRDGGVDARVSYRRGVVSAKALVSAKHWSGGTVSVTEVRNVRGIPGDEDTAIIVTSGSFTTEAVGEAAKRAGVFRLVYLIDGNGIVNACKQHGIGVTRRQLPELFELDSSFLLGVDEEEEEEEDEDAEVEAVDPKRADAAPAATPKSGRRLREEMLGDDERGLSVAEIAALTGHAASTVGQYLYVRERRRSLFQKLRADTKLREKALEIVARKRGIA